jgi:hypothetical protein
MDRLVPLRFAVFVIVALATSGCAIFGGARVEAVATSVQKPSNVALLLEVTEAGEPVTGLEPQNFKVYENEQELAPDQVKRTLLDRRAVTAERVVLLVDLFGQPSSSERSRLVRAVEVFVEKLRENLAVSVFAFDGSDSLKSVGDYARGGGAASASALSTIPGPDGSRNLHGAVLDGVRQLELRLGSENKPVRLGTLVVVAHGPDLANRTTEDRMNQVLESVRFDVVAVGIGQDTPYLGFARSGVVHAQSADTLPIALEEAAMRVVATHGKYYLVAYCSPARAGERRVKVEVLYATKTGDERSGSVTHDFDATGFGPGCRPETPPRFAPEKGGAPAGAASGAAVNKAPEAAPAGEVVPPPPSKDYTP